MRSIVCNTMKIVLVSSPDLQTNFGGPFAPLGLLYLAGSVRKIPEVDVVVIDAYSEGLSVDQSLERILALTPDILGISPTSETFEGAWGILKSLKKVRPDVLTILGGFYATIFDRLLLREIPELDMVLRGECEHSFPEFCRHLLFGKDLAGVPGLSFRASGDIVSGEPQRVENLDSIPFPDRSVVDRHEKAFEWAGYRIPEFPPIAAMISSRGCPFQCNFCTLTPRFARGWRARSAENVLDELLDLKREGYKFVLFVDNNFTVDLSRVHRLSKMIIDQNLHKTMRYFTQGTLEHVPDSTLQLMHKAGFDGMYVGVESGSDAQLKRFNKATTGNKMAEGILRAKKAHMFVVSSFIIGGKEETDEDRKNTYEFVKKVKPLVCEIGWLRVHPGTPLWEQMVGPDEPDSVENSLTKTIDRFPDQPDEDTLDDRRRAFESVFGSTFGRGRRLREAISLILHNPTARWFVGLCLRRPSILMPIYKRLFR